MKKGLFMMFVAALLVGCTSTSKVQNKTSISKKGTFT